MPRKRKAHTPEIPDSPPPESPRVLLEDSEVEEDEEVEAVLAAPVKKKGRPSKKSKAEDGEDLKVKFQTMTKGQLGDAMFRTTTMTPIFQFRQISRPNIREVTSQ